MFALLLCPLLSFFCLSGDWYSFSRLASQTACPADESGELGDHRVASVGVWMHQRAGL